MHIIPKRLNISMKRLKKGISMRELARRAGLNIGTISNIESKNKNIAPKTAKLICDVLEANFDDLFEIVESSAIEIEAN